MHTRQAELSALLPSAAKLFVAGANAADLFVSGFQPHELTHTALAPGADLSVCLKDIPENLYITVCVQSRGPCRVAFLWNGTHVRKLKLTGELQKLGMMVEQARLRSANTFRLEILDDLPPNTPFLDVHFLALESNVSPREMALRWFIQYNGRFPSDDLPLFNDALFHRKMELWDKKTSRYADKIAVRDYVAETVGPEYLIPMQGVFARPEDIDRTALRYPCMVKSNHACGQVLALENAETPLDMDSLRAWLSVSFYQMYGEPCYRDIVPRLYVEDKINTDGKPIEDYKFHCFGGQVRCIAYIPGRESPTCMTHFSPDWEPMPFAITNLHYDKPVPRPPALEKMLRVAETLSKPFKYIRVDLYCHDEKNILVGELTFFHYNAVGKNTSAYWDRWLAEQYRSVLHAPGI